VKRSFRKDFRIIFLEEKIEFKRNYLKKDRGKAAVRRGRCNEKNGLRRRVGAEKGNKTGREKQVGCGKLDQKS
jgi:hypothetical protein